MVDISTALTVGLNELPDVHLMAQKLGALKSVRLVPGGLILSLISGATVGVKSYATIAARNADTISPIGTLAYVYLNNGVSNDPANGYYQRTATNNVPADWGSATWLANVFVPTIQALRLLHIQNTLRPITAFQMSAA
jgi:hypothetical protein